MVKNLTCRNENTNRKACDYNLPLLLLLLRPHRQKLNKNVSQMKFSMNKETKWMFRANLDSWSTSWVAGFQFILLLNLSAVFLGFLGKCFEHQWKYFAASSRRITTSAQGPSLSRRCGGRSEQQNRRKFLFILFVIISFLHYEYLRSWLYFFIHFYTFYLRPKKKNHRSTAQRSCKFV